MKSLLRNGRKNKGLTIREVALTLNIDQALVSKFETGHRKPTRDQLVQLAILFEIELDDLLVLWLKEKILNVIKGEELGLKALKAATAELNPESPENKSNLNAFDSLFEEMNALRNKMENLRNETTSS